MRPLLTACVLGAALAQAFGAEEPATTPGAGDSISAAKRDFETIKAARTGTLPPSDGLPRLSVPELHMPAPLPSSLTGEKGQKANANKKSANWLVEAMERKPAKPGAARDRLEKADDLRGDLRLQIEANREGLADAPDDRTTPVEKEPKSLEVPPNPLNLFLADWMTPADYALLKPRLEAAQTAATASRQEMPGSMGSLFPAGSGIITLPGQAGDGRPAPDRVFSTTQSPPDNPYLRALNEPAPRVFVPLAPAALAPLPQERPRAVSAPPVAPPPPPSRIPEFVKPATDDKYFKPLKRF